MNKATTSDPTIKRSLTNIAAEAALLGGLMISNGLIDSIAEVLKREDFAEPLHGDIYRAILRMRSQGEAATPVTLFAIFDNDQRFSQLGGVGYLAKLTESSAGLIGPHDLARQIIHLSGLRKAEAALEDALEQIHAPSDTLPDIPAIQGELESRLWAASEAGEVVRVRNPGDMLKSVRDRIGRLKSGVSIGATNLWISDFNVAFGPLEPKNYFILAGRPSMGKTVLAVSSMLGYAAGGTPCLYIHGEMTAEQMDMRVICDLGFALGHNFTLDQMKKGRFTDEEMRKLERIAEVSELMPFQFIESGPVDVSQINSYVARACAYWKSQGRKLGVVVVDYLQLMHAESIIGAHQNSNTTARVQAVSSALLKIAKRHGITLIALSQLSRKVEERPEPIPQMSDLRESGKIEEDADGVALLYRAEYYLERKEPPTKAKDFEDHEALLAASRGKADLIVAKNRHGKVMKRTMKFYGEHASMRGGDHTEFSDMFGAQNDLFKESEVVL